VVGTWATYLGVKDSPLVEDVLFERGALGTQRPAIDGMVGIAFGVIIHT